MGEGGKPGARAVGEPVRTCEREFFWIVSNI